MPYLIRPRRLLGIATGALLAIAGLPAVAQAACPTTPVTNPFAQFGDSNDYSLLSGASFESGTTGWSLTKAAVASGNESYKVRASTDAKSLVVQPTGIAVSPAFCVGIEHPSFRFFAKQASGSWATLNVKVRWKDSTGGVHDTTVGSLNGSSFTSWTPTWSLALASSLPLWMSGQTIQAQIVLDPEDYGGSWAIDDIFIDPYTRS